MCYVLTYVRQLARAASSSDPAETFSARLGVCAREQLCIGGSSLLLLVGLQAKKKKRCRTFRKQSEANQRRDSPPRWHPEETSEIFLDWMRKEKMRQAE